MTVHHTDILATVAHDLQTPLTALKAHLCITNRKYFDEKHVKTCHAIIDHMSSMVRDALAFADSYKRPKSSRYAQFNMSESVENTLEYVDAIASVYRITLIKKIAPNLMVSGTRERIEEAFLNILSNAMKYLERSGMRVITVSLKRQENECVLAVRDTGIGIPPEDLENVFTRFYRTASATTHASGSGLGLAITKNIIEAHGGTISLRSLVGKGTTVEIKLPLMKKVGSKDIKKRGNKDTKREPD